MIAAKKSDQYMLRLPPGLRDRVARRAKKNGRSMNTEIIDAIERHLTGLDRLADLEARIKRLEQRCTCSARG
jgi:predicted DNA-binding protein